MDFSADEKRQHWNICRRFESEFKDIQEPKIHNAVKELEFALECPGDKNHFHSIVKTTKIVCFAGQDSFRFKSEKLSGDLISYLNDHCGFEIVHDKNKEGKITGYRVYLYDSDRCMLKAQRIEEYSEEQEILKKRKV